VARPDDEPDRPSIIAVPSGASSGPTVVLDGHLGTVGVTGMHAPFTPHVEGNKLYGRGAAEGPRGLNRWSFVN
jgi:acetylornithine deacetylase